MKLRKRRRPTLFTILIKPNQSIVAPDLLKTTFKSTKGDTRSSMKLSDSMLGYAEGHLFAAFDDKIYYVNVRKNFKDIEQDDKEEA